MRSENRHRHQVNSSGKWQHSLLHSLHLTMQCCCSLGRGAMMSNLNSHERSATYFFGKRHKRQHLRHAPVCDDASSCFLQKCLAALAGCHMNLNHRTWWEFRSFGFILDFLSYIEHSKISSMIREYLMYLLVLNTQENIILLVSTKGSKECMHVGGKQYAHVHGNVKGSESWRAQPRSASENCVQWLIKSAAKSIASKTLQESKTKAFSTLDIKTSPVSSRKFPFL